MPLPKQVFEPEWPGPLQGVRVLDLSRLVAGNMLSLQLADFGAEVVKVETPGRDDTLRDWREASIPVHWQVYARNKKSITLNLKAPDAPRILFDLAALRRPDRKLPVRLSRAPRRGTGGAPRCESAPRDRGSRAGAAAAADGPHDRGTLRRDGDGHRRALWRRASGGAWGGRARVWPIMSAVTETRAGRRAVHVAFALVKLPGRRFVGWHHGE